jgi:regulator of sigma E protease
MFVTILIFVAVLSVLVFVHELGHFLTARFFGVKCEEFGMGLPPRAIGWQLFKQKHLEKIGESDSVSVKVETIDLPSGDEAIKETVVEEKKEIDVMVSRKKWRIVWGNRETNPDEPLIYSLNWIPVGGFVKIKGENGDEAADTDSFGHQPIWQRNLILAAGVTMNIVLTVILLAVAFSFGVPGSTDNLEGGKLIDQPKVQVVEVLKGSPADMAGLRAGDVISSIDGQAITSSKALQDLVASKENQTVKILVKRGETDLEKSATVAKVDGQAALGVGIVDLGTVRYPIHLAFWQALKTTWAWLVMIALALVGLIKQLFGGPSVGAEFAGPVGIAVMTGQAAQLGWTYVLQFAAMLSLNLAIINILPFPALDGGRILFLTIGKLRGKMIDAKWENFSHNFGFILLMALIVFITYRDLLKYGAKILSVLSRSVGL